jgi:hypothetical protein
MIPAVTIPPTTSESSGALSRAVAGLLAKTTTIRIQYSQPPVTGSSELQMITTECGVRSIVLYTPYAAFCLSMEYRVPVNRSVGKVVVCGRTSYFVV